MTRLEQALQAAEERKDASLGSEAHGLTMGDDFQQRAVFSGFDLDFAELVEVQERVGLYFCRIAPFVGLRFLFSSAWVDGLLVGLMLSLPPADTGGTDAPGSVEGEA